MRLPNGYGSVYKLSGKRRKPWIVRKTIGWEVCDDRVRQKYITIGFYSSKQLALQALSDFNEAPYDIEMSRATFDDVYKIWFRKTFGDKESSTSKNYKIAYKHCDLIKQRHMSDLRPVHLQAVLDACPAGYQTAKRIKTLMSKVFDFCVQNDYLRTNYADRIEVKQKNDPTPKQAFTRKEIATLWESVGYDNRIELVLMLIYSGVRISELLTLKKSDVDLDNRIFYVRKSKTRSGQRIVPIADKVLPFWEKYMTAPSPYAVSSETGLPIEYSNFQKTYWQPVMNFFNFNHSPHETRHTCISLLVMANVNQTVIKKIVGHKSIMSLTEAVYTHIEVEDLLKAINSI